MVILAGELSLSKEVKGGDGKEFTSAEGVLKFINKELKEEKEGMTPILIFALFAVH